MESNQLRRLGQYERLVYEAVKDGRTAELPHEGQLYARAIREHLDVPGVHNALEFADLRGDEPFESQVDGQPVSPLAHLAAHGAVLSMLENNGDAKAAFEALRKEGIGEHHAVHILSGLLVAWLSEEHGEVVLPDQNWRDIKGGKLEHELRRICQSRKYRRKLAGTFVDSHRFCD